MIITLKELSAVRDKFNDKKVVLTTGTFDLLHIGHLLFLEQVKMYGDILVIMLSGDERVKSRKGSGRPIIPEDDRAKMLDALKIVDYVFIDSGINENGQANPVYAQIIDSLKPDYYVTDGDDVRFSKIIEKEKYIILSRSKEQTSTTQIINKITS